MQKEHSNYIYIYIFKRKLRIIKKEPTKVQWVRIQKKKQRRRFGNWEDKKVETLLRFERENQRKRRIWEQVERPKSSKSLITYTNRWLFLPTPKLLFLFQIWKKMGKDSLFQYLFSFLVLNFRCFRVGSLNAWTCFLVFGLITCSVAFICLIGPCPLLPHCSLPKTTNSRLLLPTTFCLC